MAVDDVILKKATQQAEVAEHVDARDAKALRRTGQRLRIDAERCPVCPDRAAVAAAERQGAAADDQYGRRARRHFLSTAQRWSVALSAIGVPALADGLPLLPPVPQSRPVGHYSRHGCATTCARQSANKPAPARRSWTAKASRPPKPAGRRAIAPPRRSPAASATSWSTRSA